MPLADAQGTGYRMTSHTVPDFLGWASQRHNNLGLGSWGPPDMSIGTSRRFSKILLFVGASPISP